jgi:hypothetical protein
LLTLQLFRPALAPSFVGRLSDRQLARGGRCGARGLGGLGAHRSGGNGNAFSFCFPGLGRRFGCFGRRTQPLAHRRDFFAVP